MKRPAQFIYVETAESLRQRQRDTQEFRNSGTAIRQPRVAPPAKLLTKKQLAEHFKISERKLDGWIENGLPVAIHGGKGRGNVSMFDVESAEDWRDANDDPIITADQRDWARERFILEKALARFRETHGTIPRAAMFGMTSVLIAAMREFDGRPPLRDDGDSDAFPIQLFLMRVDAPKK